MTARIIDGKVIAAELRARVADEVSRVKRENGLTPGLAVTKGAVLFPRLED